MEEVKPKKKYESTARAKAKYAKSEKGKETNKKCYENHREERLVKERINRKLRKERNDAYKAFYEKFKDVHPDFQI